MADQTPPPAPAPMPVIYPYLAEQAQVCRAQHCPKAAEAFDELAAQLLECFGNVRLVGPVAGMRWRLICERYEWQRVQAAQRGDRVAELIFACALSAILRALAVNEGKLIPDEAAGIADEVRKVIEGGLSKIQDDRCQEAALVRATVQNRVKFEARQFHEQQQREQLAANARFALAAARAAGADVELPQ